MGQMRNGRDDAIFAEYYKEIWTGYFVFCYVANIYSTVFVCWVTGLKT